MKKNTIIIISSMFVITNMFAQGVSADIQKAQKNSNSIFLIVTDKLAKGTDYLVKLSEGANKKVKKNVVLKLDRDEKENADLVAKYRIAGAQLPLILVVASNGVVSGALTSDDASIEKIISTLPSKTQAEVLLGFENGKAALIICGKKNAKDKAAIQAECNTAVTSLGNKATVVFVDVESKEEANFIELLKPDLTKTTVVIFNGKGQFTGKMDSVTKSEDLVKTVNKRVGGCAPGSCGSGKKC